MSRSKHAVELCSLLVNEAYGELTSRIFTILLRRGRLTTRLLSTHTGLTARQVRNGLIVLIQQGLVYHNRDPDGATHYEANHDAAYALTRSGKIMEVVESRYGEFARNVMQNLFLLGHTKVSDLAEAYESGTKTNTNAKTNGHTVANGTNGVNGVNGHGEAHSSTGPLHTILSHLLQAGIIEPVVESMLQSPTDLYNKIERELLAANFSGSTKGNKQKEELKAQIRSRLNAARTEGRQWHGKAKKRPANGDHNELNGNNKRRRLSSDGGSVNGDYLYEDDGTRLDPQLVVRINYEKCTVFLRSQALVAFASERIGETTSLVYAEAMRLLEEKIPRCRLDSNIDEVDDLPDGPSFTTIDITNSLNKSVNVGAGIGKSASDRANSPKRSRKNGPREQLDGDVDMEDRDSDDDTMVNGNGDGEEGPFELGYKVPKAKRQKVTFQDKPSRADQPFNSENRMQQIRNHLQLLASDDCHFLRKCGNNGQGEWTVDFEVVLQHMQEEELDAMILETFGTFGHRLARMLRKFGKLDEKQLPTLALMKQKDVRTKLAEMQMAGIVDIQEVPRDNGRTTARTIFLWFFDSERVATMIVENVYKAMARCLVRLDIERRKAVDVIAITERSDVRDEDPESYLDPAQLNLFQQVQAKEDSLSGQVFRLDQVVGIFRDF